MAMESFNLILLPPALIPYSLLFLANPDWELIYLSYPKSDIKQNSYNCSNTGNYKPSVHWCHITKFIA